MQKLTRYGSANTQDVFKCVALFAMLLDHIGTFLLPDVEGLRIVGRISMPIWLFFAGYNLYASNQRELWWWGGVMVLLGLVTHQPVFPLNILITIALARLALDSIFTHQWFARYPKEVVACCIVLALPTLYAVEYGTEALLFALMGRLVRQQQDKKTCIAVSLAASVTYVVLQWASFSFSLPLGVVMSALVAITVWTLCTFEQRMVTLPVFAMKYVPLCARYSLYIYVGHRAILQIAALYLYPETYTGFRWLESQE